MTFMGYSVVIPSAEMAEHEEARLANCEADAALIG
jgi:hypothetical protein